MLLPTLERHCFLFHRSLSHTSHFSIQINPNIVLNYFLSGRLLVDTRLLCYPRYHGLSLSSYVSTIKHQGSRHLSLTLMSLQLITWTGLHFDTVASLPLLSLFPLRKFVHIYIFTTAWVCAANPLVIACSRICIVTKSSKLARKHIPVHTPAERYGQNNVRLGKRTHTRYRACN
jgi:hypothetical protein